MKFRPLLPTSQRSRGSNGWAAVLCLAFASCALATAPATRPAGDLTGTTGHTQTLGALGACHSASEHDGFAYLYGDANPGTIRQYQFDNTTPPQLTYTGMQLGLMLERSTTLAR